MCGFFGILKHNDNATVDGTSLQQSCSLLSHRGPDHKKVWIEGPIGLAHTRLSLLDLSDRSNQPLHDITRRYTIVYNGEIYNFLNLRRKIEEQGFEFRTTSDTEVLLACLVHYGPEAALARLEGMFAFAMYDAQERQLVLARDPFGIKPLYVVDTPSAFLFASEIQAFRPWLKFEPDMLTISEYLHGFPGPTKGFSFYGGVRIAEPGNIIRITQGSAAQSRRYFVMSNLWDEVRFDELNELAPSKVVDTVEEQLFESVRMQLVADVPVGALCSGGVDSSVIMAMAARIHTNLAVFHAKCRGAQQ